MKIFLMIIFLLFPNIILAKQFYSSLSKSTIYLNDRWVETEKSALEMWNKELTRAAPTFKGYSNRYNFKDNDLVYILVQVLKGRFKPRQIVKGFKLTKNKVIEKSKKAFDKLNLGFKINKFKLNTPFWSEELKALVSKASMSRSDGVEISYITFWFFLKNHIAVFHCYYPDNRDLSQFYTKTMSNIKFDTAYIKSENWFISLYELLGLKFNNEKSKD